MVQKTLLNDSPENLIAEYRLILEKHNIPVHRIIMFGSYAKGIADAWSDVDICVVSPSFGKNPFDERVLLKKLTLEIDSLIEPHPYNPRDLQDPYDPLAYEIRTYGIEM